MSNFENMTKAQLIEMLQNQKAGGRKEQVLALLKKGFDTIEAIAEELGITTKNVSSQLTYLRNDGHIIININVHKQSILMLLNQEQYDYIMSLQAPKQ